MKSSTHLCTHIVSGLFARKCSKPSARCGHVAPESRKGGQITTEDAPPISFWYRRMSTQQIFLYKCQDHTQHNVSHGENQAKDAGTNSCWFWVRCGSVCAARVTGCQLCCYWRFIVKSIWPQALRDEAESARDRVGELEASNKALEAKCDGFENEKQSLARKVVLPIVGVQLLHWE